MPGEGGGGWGGVVVNLETESRKVPASSQIRERRYGTLVLRSTWPVEVTATFGWTVRGSNIAVGARITATVQNDAGGPPSLL